MPSPAKFVHAGFVSFLLFKYSTMEGKRTIQSQGQSITEHSKLGGEFIKGQNPAFLKDRLNFFSLIKKRLDDVLANVDKPQITITLKDGKEIKGNAFETTPLSIARGISKNLAEAVLVARVKYGKKYESPFGKGPVAAEAEDVVAENNEYELVDMTRPLEGDCLMELVTFDDKIGKEVFWHSSAHLLGQSLENAYGAWLCHGPPLENGFFYDSFVGDYKMSQADYDTIEKEIKKYSSEKQPYERVLLTKAEALEMFSYNPFKVQLIKNKIPEDGLTSAYRCGNLIDLCTGPHLPSADKVKGFKVMKNSSAYWLGKKENDDLQRVYAISFPKQSLLDEYVKQQEDLAKRDHRVIGPKQELFNFTTLTPGSALFYPHGTIIYNRLIDLMRSEYRIRGYSEVLSPNIYHTELWKISGHYFKYKDNLFFLEEENGEHMGLKPMNCPGHCVMFDLYQRSYRDLPLRYADFGVLHRNELHGALSGLTRVRRFQQDDAHHFCRPDQIEEEILGVLDLLHYIYSVFGFKYILEFSTRPEKFLGDIEDWNLAEAQLKGALEKFGKQHDMDYRLNEGDGAFYGPKIDVKLFDVFGREHQCGTCQLDFQLPQRFNLQYRAKEAQKEKEEVQEGQQGEPKEKKGKKKQKVEVTPEEIERRKKEKAEKKKQQEAAKQEKSEQPEKKEEQAEDKKVEDKQHDKKEEKKKESMEEMEERYNKLHPIKQGFARPVIVHRAIFGSLERFIAILCEHLGGKWDFWVSPRQIKLIPIGKEAEEFTHLVENTLLLHDYAVVVDRSGDKLDKKVRNAQIEAFNFIGVIGKEEVKTSTINLRKRDEAKEEGKFTIPQLLQLFASLKAPKSKKRLQLQAQSIPVPE